MSEKEFFIKEIIKELNNASVRDLRIILTFIYNLL